jgi:two-component system sensor histidine kinase AlgZ
MHPILLQRRRLVLYLMAWLPVLALLTSMMVLTGWGRWTQSVIFGFPLVTVYAFLCLAAWYPCRALPLDDQHAALALGTHIATATISAAVWVGMAWALATLVDRSVGLERGGRLSSEQMGLIFILGLLLYLLSVAIHYLFAAAETSRAAERRALEAEVAARDAELQALKAQLNPHFLFNSLNSVASLAGSDPARARAMCIELGDYLRGTLNEQGAVLQPLKVELAMVRRFLNVESVRYGDRLRVVEKIDDGCADCAVPPLLLQPLVENALKHGIAQLVEGGEVRIGAECRGRQLTLWVENPVDQDYRARPGAGVGLDNVRQRLEKVFGADARLRHAKRGDSYRAEVVLPVVGAGDGIVEEGVRNGG